MATIMDLPMEVLLKILEYKNISVTDIANLSFTCKQFQYIINDEILWREKYFQM